VRSSVITLRLDYAIMGARAATISTKPARLTFRLNRRTGAKSSTRSNDSASACSGPDREEGIGADNGGQRSLPERMAKVPRTQLGHFRTPNQLDPDMPAAIMSNTRRDPNPHQ